MFQDLSKVNHTKMTNKLLQRIPSFQQLLQLLQQTMFPKYYNHSILSTHLPTHVIRLITSAKTKSMWQTSFSKLKNHFWKVQVKWINLTCITTTEYSQTPKLP